MKRATCALALLAMSLAPNLRAADALIEIDAAKPAAYKIPRTIYGTFLEPIGHSIYPGLWAQVLENPSFEDNLWSVRNLERMVEAEPALGRSSSLGLPLPWQPLDQAQGARYEPRWNDAANSFRSLAIMALPGKETGVRQTVYLPVHRVLQYNGSIYVKHVSGPREIGFPCAATINRRRSWQTGKSPGLSAGRLATSFPSHSPPAR